MKTTEIVKSIAARPATVELVPQKAWAKLAGPHGAKLYVRQPDAAGEIDVAQISGWGYGGLPKGLELPADCVKPIDDNGAVSLEVDLAKAPSGWLDRAIAHLAQAVAEPDPRRTRTRAKRPSRPTLAEMIAQSTAPADAKSDAPSVDVFHVEGGPQVDEASAPSTETEDEELARLIAEEEASVSA